MTVRRCSFASVRMAIALSLGLGACDTPPEIPEITIGGLDYAFAVPASIPAGPVRIAFENRGEVAHELVLVRLKPNATLQDMTEAMSSGSDPREFVDGIAGILIADPGEVALGRLSVEFTPGRTYALVCNFTDSEEAPPHSALGMMSAFTVG